MRYPIHSCHHRGWDKYRKRTMTTDNDQFLESILKGNILEALEQLYRLGGDSPEAALSLNRLLYGSGEEEQLEAVREEEAKLSEQLAGLDADMKAEGYYNLGCFSLVQDDIVSARTRFSEAIRLAPQHLMARHNLAYAHELLAETEEARHHYQDLLAQKPDCALTRLNLAQIRLQEDDRDGAVGEMEALQSQDPSNKGVLLFLCRALLFRAGQEDVEKAVALLSEVPGLKHYPDLHECLAYAQYLHQDFDAAEAAFSELLAENEDNLFARMGLIKILSEKGDFSALEAHVEKYQAANPTEKMHDLMETIRPSG